jgi:antitoxin component YwqK of YwqJK toxin-antitoxin module
MFINTRWKKGGWKKQYEGEWKNDLQHGRGLCLFHDGKKCYEGEYKNGTRHGRGA